MVPATAMHPASQRLLVDFAGVPLVDLMVVVAVLADADPAVAAAVVAPARFLPLAGPACALALASSSPSALAGGSRGRPLPPSWCREGVRRLEIPESGRMRPPGIHKQRRNFSTSK